jgi:hypothetical protein
MEARLGGGDTVRSAVAVHRFLDEFKPSHCGKSFGFLILLNEAYPLSCRQLALLAQTSYREASFDVKGQ